MRVLRIALGAERPCLFRIIVCAVPAENVFLCRGLCLLGQSQGVGTHVGNQTGQALLADLDAFIQLLGNRHRAARHKAQLAASFLLQRRSNKRRRRSLAFFAALDLAHGKRLAGYRFYDVHGLFFGFQFDLARRIAVKRSGKHTALLRFQLCLERPIFLRHKGTDFHLSIHNHARCNRLHTAGGQTALDLSPQKRRQLIAHDAIQNAACLLGIDQIQVNIARVRNAVLHGVLGNFIECDAFAERIAQVKQLF